MSLSNPIEAQSDFELNENTSNGHENSTLKQIPNESHGISNVDHQVNQEDIEMKPILIQETGSMMFNCSICSQLFNKKANLKIHLRKHSGEKPYSCKYSTCKKSFMWKSSLTFHESICKASTNAVEPVNSIKKQTKAKKSSSSTRKKGLKHSIVENGLENKVSRDKSTGKEQSEVIKQEENLNSTRNDALKESGSSIHGSVVGQAALMPGSTSNLVRGVSIGDKNGLIDMNLEMDLDEDAGSSQVQPIYTAGLFGNIAGYQGGIQSAAFYPLSAVGGLFGLSSNSGMNLNSANSRASLFSPNAKVSTVSIQDTNADSMMNNASNVIHDLGRTASEVNLSSNRDWNHTMTSPLMPYSPPPLNSQNPQELLRTSYMASPSVMFNGRNIQFNTSKPNSSHSHQQT